MDPKCGIYLGAGIELGCASATGSLTGARLVGFEIDCLFDLSLLSTKLALLMNFANPLGLSSDPPEPPCPEAVILVEIPV